MTPNEAFSTAVEHHRQGRLALAENLYRAILSSVPGHAGSLDMLGILAHQCGQAAQGLAFSRQAVALEPDNPAFLNNLGTVLAACGELDAALDAHGHAFALAPALTDAGLNLGNILCRLGRMEEAAYAYRHLLDHAPDCFEAANRLVTCCLSIGALEAALKAARHGLALAPDHQGLIDGMGVALRSLGRSGEAIACFRHSVDLHPDDASAWTNLANPLLDQGRVGEAVAGFRRALAIAPDLAQARDNLLYALQYDPGIDLDGLVAEHKRLRPAPPADGARPPRSFRRSRKPGRPLRVGYLSPDFRRHPVGYFILPVIAAHDPAKVVSVCYSAHPREDDIGARIRESAGLWRPIAGLDDDALAAMIEADDIDILVDLAGYSSGSRLRVMARRLAPIQASWIGSVFTTGVEAVDYFITDHFESPPGAERHFTETLIRLPQSWLCVEPPLDAPLPRMPERGPLTFGCCNNTTKMNDATVRLFGRVMAAQPDSRLLLRTRGYEDASLRQRVLRLLAAEGVTAERVSFEGRCTRDEMLETYGRIDVALDPFPYSGGLTTIEALWMGVPVVTLAGERFTARHSLSFLSTLGLQDWIAATPDDYVAIAGRLAQDREARTRWRRELRPLLAASPLCDGKGFTAGLEREYARIWRHWLDTTEASP